jgi:hypothetical protein
MRGRPITNLLEAIIVQAGEEPAWYHPALDPADDLVHGDEAIKWCHI